MSVVLIRNPNPTKIAVVPEYCECWNHSPRQKVIATGLGRAVLAFILLALCIAYLVIFAELNSSVFYILIVICFINILLFINCMCLISAASVKKVDIIQKLLINDIAMAVICMVLGVIFMFLCPANFLIYYLTIKLLIFSGYFVYRSQCSYKYFNTPKGMNFETFI